jgi:single-strand DNA-binding protein
MAGGTYLTISGNLTAAPKSGSSRTGAPWAKLRVASTSRVFDRAESQWRDGDTVFLDVICWRRMAENVVASLDRGDRVIVSGRVHQRTYEDQQGVRHTVTELEAESIGPDLVRAAARLIRASTDQRAALSGDGGSDTGGAADGESTVGGLAGAGVTVLTRAPEPEPSLS